MSSLRDKTPEEVDAEIDAYNQARGITLTPDRTETSPAAVQQPVADDTEVLDVDEALEFLQENKPADVGANRELLRLFLRTPEARSKPWTQKNLLAFDLNEFVDKVAAADVNNQRLAPGEKDTTVARREQERLLNELGITRSLMPTGWGKQGMVKELELAGRQARELLKTIENPATLGGLDPTQQQRSARANLGPQTEQGWVVGSDVPQPSRADQTDFSQMTLESTAGYPLTDTGDPISALLQIEQLRRQHRLPPIGIRWDAPDVQRFSGPAGSTNSAEQRLATADRNKLSLNQYIVKPREMPADERDRFLDLLARAGYVDRSDYANGLILASVDDPVFMAGYRRLLNAYVAQSGDLEGVPNPNAKTVMELLRERAGMFDAKGVNDFDKLRTGDQDKDRADYRMTDPARIRSIGRDAGTDALGRWLTPEEEQRLVGEMHLAEREYGAELGNVSDNGRTDGLIDPDIEARVREAVREYNPDEAEAHDLARQFAVFQQLITGPGFTFGR